MRIHDYNVGVTRNKWPCSLRAKELTVFVNSMARSLDDPEGTFRCEGDYARYEGASGTRIRAIDLLVGLSSEPHQNSLEINSGPEDFTRVMEGLQHCFEALACSARIQVALTQDVNEYELWVKSFDHGDGLYEYTYECQLKNSVRKFFISGQRTPPVGLAPRKAFTGIEKQVAMKTRVYKAVANIATADFFRYRLQLGKGSAQTNSARVLVFMLYNGAKIP